MALGPQQNNGSSRRSMSAIAEINMTPFIDVMLVLLIIFMITAPLLTVGVDVSLPKTAASTITEDKKPLVVSIKKTAAIYVQETPVDRTSLISKLDTLSGQKKDVKIYIQADEGLSYGTFMEIMGLINRAGYKRVALIGEALETR